MIRLEKQGERWVKFYTFSSQKEDNKVENYEVSEYDLTISQLELLSGQYCKDFENMPYFVKLYIKNYINNKHGEL